MNFSKQQLISVLAIFFLLQNPCVLKSSVELDTRVTSTHRYKSFVFDTQQTFTDRNFARGDIEFRAGLIPDAFNISMDLSVTPPLSGEINSGPFPGGYTITQFNIFSDLTLGSANFAVPSGVSLNTRFAFKAQSKIFLTSDLMLDDPNGLNLGIDTASATGTIDGQGNRIVFAEASGFGVTGSRPLTFRNVTIVDFVSGGVGGSGNQIFMNNIECITPQVGFFILANSPFIFIGKHNIFGHNGLLLTFTNASNGVQIIIDKQSRITVTPGTTLSVGQGTFFVDPILGFVDKTSELFLDNCTLDHGAYSGFVGTQTLKLTKGTIYINGTVKFASSNGGPIQLGDGVDPANNCDVIILPGSKLIVEDGTTLINANV